MTNDEIDKDKDTWAAKEIYNLLLERRMGAHKLPKNIQFHIDWSGGKVKTTIMPMFLHLREHKVIAYDSNTNEAVLEVAPKGGVTVAFTYTPNKVRYACAYCNIFDHFNKHTGRVKSAGRLNSKDQWNEFEVDEDATVNQVIEQIKQRVYNEREQYDPRYRLYVF